MQHTSTSPPSAQAPANPAPHRFALGRPANRVFQTTSAAGKLLIRDDANEPVAEIFYVAYTRKDADAKTRPVTFLWDGGPGASTTATSSTDCWAPAFRRPGTGATTWRT